MVNPYRAPVSTPKQNNASRRRYLLLSIASFVCALFVSWPGISLLVSIDAGAMPAGRRYATYDPEFSILGLHVAPSTFIATLIVVGFAMVGLSAYFACIWRWRRFPGDARSESER